MVRDLVPIRSISNLRGDDLEAVEAATTIGLDALYVDLEEPRTPLSEADRAVIRTEAGEWLRGRQRGAGIRLFSRVQAVSSGQTLRDLEAIVCPALEGILLPKVNGAADIIAADAVLSALEAEHQLEPGSILLYPILETAQSLRRAYEIVLASPRVAYMGGAVSRFGDIVQAVGYRWTPGGQESLMFRASTLVDCRAAGMPYPITGGSAQDTSRIDNVRRWAEEGRALGYRGSQIRALPAHVAIVNEVFSPTADEIAAWRDIVARAEGRADGAPFDGAPSDEPMVGSARASLAWAATLGLS